MLAGYNGGRERNVNSKDWALFSTALIQVGLGLGLVMTLAVSAALAQQSGDALEDGGVEENELVVGKWIYVEPMSGDFQTWIIEFLRQWGKYKVTGDPEGVDLVWKANMPRRGVRFRRNRQGIPTPREDIPEERGALTMSVVDWVTGKRLWHVIVVPKKKKKKKDPDPPFGPRTRIYSKKMSREQLADTLVKTLRSYVEELEGVPNTTEDDQVAPEPSGL